MAGSGPRSTAKCTNIIANEPVLNTKEPVLVAVVCVVCPMAITPCALLEVSVDQPLGNVAVLPTEASYPARIRELSPDGVKALMVIELTYVLLAEN